METLFKSNRKVLLTIVPHLQEYVENSYRRELRRLAACALGRIGALDPDAITLNFVTRWAHAKDAFYRASVGYLYEGILDSEDETYRKFCMGFLKNMALSNDIKIQWTAIAAYKQIGLHKLEFAMQELRKIQEEIVDRLLKTEDMLDVLYREGASEVDILGNLNILYEETHYLLSTVRYSVVALCIMIDPIEVISELHKWISEGNRNSKISVVMFFLGIDGILQVLENRQAFYITDDDDKDSLSGNILLNALTIGDEAINKMVLFLKDLFEKCFPKFRLNDQNDLKQILFDHLEQWTVDTFSKTRISRALQKLIVGLYNAGSNDLKDTLWNAVNQWKVPKKEEKKDEKENKENQEKKKAALKAFLDDVTSQIFDI